MSKNLVSALIWIMTIIDELMSKKDKTFRFDYIEFIDLSGIKTTIDTGSPEKDAEIYNLIKPSATAPPPIPTGKTIPAHYKARSIAALSTSIALTQKTVRVALNADLQPVDQDDLPTLFIEELSQEEIDGLRNEQRIINEEMGIVDSDSAEIVVETE
ncbi:hypothetical protein KFZ76_12920 [Methylovulum psychrotolerans]|uniref:hypothetical protein n=1 Tax=Methylovulum psychrotolerans TaxID=1704499 RepID=UPI001BFF64B0|nr:hypothetical protein [Methylovulum psychrotolerans]MBT9098603.1 hypothetical protein [Methylovulum psychrotolerans]